MLHKVFTASMNSPDDVSGIKRFLANRELEAKDIIAFMGKTEGNGCVNDFSREFATFTLQTLLSKELIIPRKKIAKKVAFVMPGRCEGVMNPHVTVFVREEKNKIIKNEKRLPVGIFHTKDFLPEELGTMIQIIEVAKGVIEAMKEVQIENKDDIHFVQIKCPLLTSDSIENAKRRNKKMVTNDTYKS